MALLVRERPYDRRRILDRAAKARRSGSRRQIRRAIALYREVLQREPDDPDLHRKLAELLAREGDVAGATASYRFACETYSKRGFDDRTIGVLRDAVERIPRVVDFWLELARLERERGRCVDALTILRRARGQFRRRRSRAAALKLLAAASKIAPGDLEIGLDYALQLARDAQKKKALRVLERLPVVQREALRRVRGRQLRIDIGLGTFGRYLRAVVTGR
ncbi:MAG: tetratricopeptide repeat protein [Myxococcota bacterium]